VYLNASATDSNGNTITQPDVLFTLVANLYSISAKRLVNTLEVVLCKQGAPTQFTSRSAQVANLRLHTREWRYLTSSVDLLVIQIGAPCALRLETILFVCFLHNHTYTTNINSICLKKALQPIPRLQSENL
jgi:hypothetical protein